MLIGIRGPIAAPSAGRAAWLLPTLLLFVLLSGFAGLIYQVLWLRLLALVFGVTVWAASTVLASFMGGLALGSFGAARFADRAGSPLRWYGLVEIGIGLSALATPLALELVERVYVGLVPGVGDDLAAVTALRVALTCAVLLVPTTLMGATLPLIVRAALSREAGLGERVSLLYATNTMGAILGVLLAGLYLVGSLGLAASFGIAAAVNVAVGVAAIGLSFRTRSAVDDSAEAPGAAVRAAPVSERAARALLIVFTLSGAATFALEVVWFRILVFYVPGTTYAFTAMLAAVLAGIALGSYAAAVVIRRGLATLRVLAGIELALGAATLLSLAVLARSQEIASLLGASGAGGSGRGDLVYLAVAFGALLPATVLFGLAFPVGLALWMGREGGARAGERLGVFYGLNVIGAIIGALGAGFVLLPTLGSQVSIVVAAAISTLSGLLLLAVAPAWRPARAVALAGVVAFVVSLALAADPFAAAIARRYPGERVLWREEGVQSTVTVHQAADGRRVLYLDGLHQANDHPEMVRLHRLIGHLPMVLHPAPRRALVVGLGGGVTAGAVARHRGTEIEVVELSPGVVGAAAWLDHVNEGVLRRPNVRVRVDDARNHLLLRPGPYDVITSDIIQPHHAGAGNVYSVEYFRLVRAALAEDGIALQWIGPFPETRHRLIMRTFLTVFPDATLWADGTLMVGTTKPLRLDPAAIARTLADRDTAEAVGSAGIRDVAALLGLFWAGPEELRAYVGDGPILTDDRPQVEYYLSLPGGERPPDLSGVRSSVDAHVRR